jgi:chromate transporter
LIPKLRQSQWAGAFLDGLNVASLALMAVVTLQLTQSALVDITTVILATVSALLLIQFRVNSAWLVLAGGLVGLLTKMI